MSVDNPPKVSVIVPVYNVAPYLARCLDSLINQTLRAIEIIVIDDCSTDQSLSILQTYQTNHPDKIVLIALNQNIKQGGARNRGLDIARGEFIGFVDSDDFVDLGLYQALYDKAIKTGADVVNYPTKRIDSKTQEAIQCKPEPLLPCGVIDTDEKKNHILACYGEKIWNKLFHKRLWHNLRFPEGIFYEEQSTMALLIFSVQQVAHVEGYYYFYCKRSTSVTGSPYSFQKTSDYLTSTKFFLSKVSPHNLNHYSHQIDANLLQWCTAPFRILNHHMRDESVSYCLKHMSDVYHIIQETLALLRDRKIQLKDHRDTLKKIKRSHRRFLVYGMRYGATTLLCRLYISRLIFRPLSKLTEKVIHALSRQTTTL